MPLIVSISSGKNVHAVRSSASNFRKEFLLFLTLDT